MRKIVTLKIDEEVYFKLVTLKGKLRCKTWDELFEKIVKSYGK